MYDIFKNIKVLDLTKVLSGPFATRLLADYGAEVIKIESEDYTDPSRSFPPLKNNWSGYYEMLNRNKYSISLNLRKESDLSKFYKLVKEADIVVENMTPSAKYKLKINYEILKKINEKLIYASLSGMDQKSDRPYFDVIAQAESGLMSLTGAKKETKIGPAIVDSYSGVNLAFGIASALYRREKTGEGTFLSVSMLASAMNLLEHSLVETSITKKNPILPGNYDTAIAPFGIYNSKNGKIVLAIGNENLWLRFVNVFKGHGFDSEEFATNEKRLINQKKLNADINKVFLKYDVKDLVDVLEKNAIPYGKVKSMKNVLSTKWHYENESLVKASNGLINYVVPGFSVVFPSLTKDNIRNAPKIGQHNKKYGL